MDILGYALLRKPTSWGRMSPPSAVVAVDQAVAHMWEELAQRIPGFEPPTGEDRVLEYVDAAVAWGMTRGTAPIK